MIKTTIKRLVPARLWTRLRISRIENDLRGFQRRTVRHNYGGYPMQVVLADSLGQGWYDNDWDMPPEIDLLRKHGLKPGAKVLDAGAHQCLVAMILERVVGPNGSVLAVEANAHNAEIGRKNRDLNRAERLTILEAAVAEHSGIVTFNRGLNGQVDDGTGQWGQLEVPARSLDDLDRQFGPFDVLFIDVEGFECHALRGARETLARRPDAFVEVHVGHGLEKLGGSVEEVIASFPDADYDKFIASEAQPEFRPYQADSPLLLDRFFLVAVRRDVAAAVERN